MDTASPDSSTATPYGTDKRAIIVLPRTPGHGTTRHGTYEDFKRQIANEEQAAIQDPPTYEIQRCVERARKDAQIEQEYFETERGTLRQAPRTIVCSQYAVEAGGQVKFTCRTCSNRHYGVFVTLRDPTSLSKNDSLVLNQSVELVTRGRQIDDQDLQKTARQIQQTCGTASVKPVGDRWLLLVEPRPSPSQVVSDPYQIATCAVEVDEDGPVVVGRTAAAQFRIRLASFLPDQQLSVMLCNAFRDALFCLEPGREMTKPIFYSYAMQLRKHYNLGVLCIANDDDVEYFLMPTQKESGAPIEKVLHVASQECLPSPGVTLPAATPGPVQVASTESVEATSGADKLNFLQFSRQLNEKARRVSLRDAEALFREIDSEGTGNVSLLEFLEVSRLLQSCDVEVALRAAKSLRRS